jgi:hypothetical protein
VDEKSGMDQRDWGWGREWLVCFWVCICMCACVFVFALCVFVCVCVCTCMSRACCRVRGKPSSIHPLRWQSFNARRFFTCFRFVQTQTERGRQK